MSDVLQVPKIYIVGPTATGKTELGLRIHRAVAHRWGGAFSPCEVISCDSVQVYRELKIGSARPSLAELAELKHHLVGHVPLSQTYTAGQFEQDAIEVMNRNEVFSREGGSNPAAWLLVGGSGFYVQALKLGMLPIQKSSPGSLELLEARLKIEGQQHLYQELKDWDLELAESIDPNDHYRLLRGLEMMMEFTQSPEGLTTELGTFRTVSELKKTQAQAAAARGVDAKGVNHLTLDLRPPSREWHTESLKQRAHRMLASGFIEEVEGLLRDGFDEHPALKSVGYLQMVEWLRGGSKDKSELVEQIVSASLRLAKKQKTWFNRDQAALQMDCANGLDRAVDIALEFLTKRLG